jgi:GNAT superfamily N-acetyltransferase
MIRLATPADIPAMIALGAGMHAESRYASRPWNPRKVCGLMDWLIAEDDGLLLVAESTGEIVGGFLGLIRDDWCTDARVACDLALYVEPAMRGGLTGARLVTRYRAWAQEQGIFDENIEAGITTGVDTSSSSRLYELLGFAPVGNLFAYQGKR